VKINLRCPACSQLEVTLADTGEFLCCGCGVCGIAVSSTGRVLWIRQRGYVRLPRKLPARAETVAPPPAS